MVTHHTASLITVRPSARSEPPACCSRSVVSSIAVMDQSSAPVSAGGSLAWRRFHATRQRGEQNRACSRRGVNDVPHCSQVRVSVMVRCYAYQPSAAGHGRAFYSCTGHQAFILRSLSSRLSVAREK
jgi:hypothetical protein